MDDKNPKTAAARNFDKQAEKLSLQKDDTNPKEIQDTTAVQARFVTPQDPVIETANGERLPTVPLKEALELNKRRSDAEEQGVGPSTSQHPERSGFEKSIDSQPNGSGKQSSQPEAAFRDAIPPQRTHPLFPDLPMYGPPTFTRNLQCLAFRTSSYFLSLSFLMVIVLGSAFTSIPMMFRHIWIRLQFKDPDARRPFFEEEERLKAIRKEEDRAWRQARKRKSSMHSLPAISSEDDNPTDEYVPLEGGPDPLLCDIRYYARRVGLECETFSVQTEDGFIISLFHIYDPRTGSPSSPSHRAENAPVCFPKPFESSSTQSTEPPQEQNKEDDEPPHSRKYPVLLIHGLLQSAGAYCANDDSSLAFLLAKFGFDVWLGNNRCGFDPSSAHTLLHPSDPRMWNWNIRQMGVMDLSALISRVLFETEFTKLGLVCHSQGTTETFVALAKGQRPDLGEKISVFCALAPAVYAGPLIGKMYFKFMRIISPGMFRIMFGIHAFIPFMMTMHRLLPGRLYGALGYRVFSFLFNWSDTRWDLGLRDRFFQFSPVYVSAESMRWWLGRECFASQKCILATRREMRREDEEDERMGGWGDGGIGRGDGGGQDDDDDSSDLNIDEAARDHTHEHPNEHPTDQGPSPPIKDRGARAWYNNLVPPFALWVAGSDELVDGRRLLRRFERGREPHVKVVHSRVIEEYEHLDVLWAMDSPEKVGREVKEVLWRSVGVEERRRCRVPRGCEGLGGFG